MDTERQLWSARTAHRLGKALFYTYWFITKDDIGAHPDEKDTRAAMGGAGTFMPSSDRSLSHLHVFLDLEDYKSYHLQSLYRFHYLGTKD